MLKNKMSPINLRAIKNLKGSFYEKIPSSNKSNQGKSIASINISSKIAEISRNNRISNLNNFRDRQKFALAMSQSPKANEYYLGNYNIVNKNN